jgi:WD40 repeat protein
MFAHRGYSLYGGHDDEINCLIFSRDLEILLTASINGFIRLWNTVYERLTFKIQEKAGLFDNTRKMNKYLLN